MKVFSYQILRLQLQHQQSMIIVIRLHMKPHPLMYLSMTIQIAVLTKRVWSVILFPKTHLNLHHQVSVLEMVSFESLFLGDHFHFQLPQGTLLRPRLHITPPPSSQEKSLHNELDDVIIIEQEKTQDKERQRIINSK